MRRLLILVVMTLVMPAALTAQASLGSDMQKQYAAAMRMDYTILMSPSDVLRFIRQGHIVRLKGNQNYKVEGASYPYVRPATKLFVERFSGQYRRACGYKLVVTSGTRSKRTQPKNASNLSVHTTGMAVDIRLSERKSCRAWLERVGLGLERQGLIDLIRENNPPHYHITVFTDKYERYVQRMKNPKRLAQH